MTISWKSHVTQFLHHRAHKIYVIERGSQMKSAARRFDSRSISASSACQALSHAALIIVTSTKCIAFGSITSSRTRSAPTASSMRIMSAWSQCVASWSDVQSHFLWALTSVPATMWDMTWPLSPLYAAFGKKKDKRSHGGHRWATRGYSFWWRLPEVFQTYYCVSMAKRERPVAVRLPRVQPPRRYEGCASQANVL